jgi:hypothetical protein
MIFGGALQRIALPRPQNHAVRRNIGEFADQLQIPHFKGTSAAQIAARSCAVEGLGFVVFTAREQLGVLVRLLQNRAPQVVFRLGHGSYGETKAFVFAWCRRGITDLFRYLEISRPAASIHKHFFRRRIVRRHCRLRSALGKARHQESRDHAVRRIAMRAAKHGIARRTARTLYPRVPGTIRPDIGNTFHGNHGPAFARFVLPWRNNETLTPEVLPSTRCRQLRS